MSLLKGIPYLITPQERFSYVAKVGAAWFDYRCAGVDVTFHSAIDISHGNANYAARV